MESWVYLTIALTTFTVILIIVIIPTVIIPTKIENQYQFKNPDAIISLNKLSIKSEYMYPMLRYRMKKKYTGINFWECIRYHFVNDVNGTQKKKYINIPLLFYSDKFKEFEIVSVLKYTSIYKSYTVITNNGQKLTIIDGLTTTSTIYEDKINTYDAVTSTSLTTSNDGLPPTKSLTTFTDYPTITKEPANFKALDIKKQTSSIPTYEVSTTEFQVVEESTNLSDGGIALSSIKNELANSSEILPTIKSVISSKAILTRNEVSFSDVLTNTSANFTIEEMRHSSVNDEYKENNSNVKDAISESHKKSSRNQMSLVATKIGRSSYYNEAWQSLIKSDVAQFSGPHNGFSGNLQEYKQEREKMIIFIGKYDYDVALPIINYYHAYGVKIAVGIIDSHDYQDDHALKSYYDFLFQSSYIDRFLIDESTFDISLPLNFLGVSINNKVKAIIASGDPTVTKIIESLELNDLISFIATMNC